MMSLLKSACTCAHFSRVLVLVHNRNAARIPRSEKHLPIPSISWHCETRDPFRLKDCRGCRTSERNFWASCRNPPEEA
eukprot:597540-Amphidinium_carterae.1